MLTTEDSVGICSTKCFPSNSKIVSALLLADHQTENIILSTNQKQVLSGFNSNFQPIRQLPVFTSKYNLQLDCVQKKNVTSNGCKAVLTLMSASDQNEVIQCGSKTGGSAFCILKDKTELNLGKLLVLASTMSTLHFTFCRKHPTKNC